MTPSAIYKIATSHWGGYKMKHMMASAGLDRDAALAIWPQVCEIRAKRELRREHGLLANDCPFGRAWGGDSLRLVLKHRHAQAERDARFHRELQLAEQAQARRARQDKLRARVFYHLRKMGFVREHTSGRSAYYRTRLAVIDLRVRVSDHDVPLTCEREFNRNAGGFTWADSGYSIDLTAVSAIEAGRWLVGLRKEIRSQQC